MKKIKNFDGVEYWVDDDKKIGYEWNNLLTKLFNYSAAIFLNIIPAGLGNFLIHKTSKKAKEVKDRATTYYALDTLYTTYKFSKKDGIFKGICEYLWFRLGNPRAVRNRLRLVKKILQEAFLNEFQVQGKKIIKVLSLGCGSARAVIETTAGLRERGFSKDNFDINLLDKDNQALEISQIVIGENGLGDYKINFFLDKIRNFDQYLGGQAPDVVEMVGVLDYLNDEKAIEIFKKIKDNLSDKGFFVTANIKNNIETKFVNNTIQWPMIYREPEDLIRVLLAAGFEKEKIKILIEPLNIHIVAVCQK